MRRSYLAPVSDTYEMLFQTSSDLARFLLNLRLGGRGASLIFKGKSDWDLNLLNACEMDDLDHVVLILARGNRDSRLFLDRMLT